jgi:predicted enzyme related to lactoylglutathione lyase
MMRGMKATVSHFEIPAGDPERAARFYRQVFGWNVEPLAWERPYFKIRGSAPSESGREGIDGGIIEAGSGLDQPLLMIHIEDADVQIVLERIVDAGGSIDLPATRVGTMGSWARFRDSEGNLLGLWQNLSSPS